jgi:hypothetical protein
MVNALCAPQAEAFIRAYLNLRLASRGAGA